MSQMIVFHAVLLVVAEQEYWIAKLTPKQA